MDLVLIFHKGILVSNKTGCCGIVALCETIQYIFNRAKHIKFYSISDKKEPLSNFKNLHFSYSLQDCVDFVLINYFCSVIPLPDVRK